MSNRSVNIELEFPVDWNGKQIKTITIRRPKGRDMRYLPEGKDESVEAMYPFFATLLSSGADQLNEEFIDEMDAADIAALADKALGFLDRKGKRPGPKKVGAR